MIHVSRHEWNDIFLGLFYSDYYTKMKPLCMIIETRFHMRISHHSYRSVVFKYLASFVHKYNVHRLFMHNLFPLKWQHTTYCP